MSKGMDIKKLNEFLAGGKLVDKATPVQDKCDCGKCCQDSAACEAGAAAPVEALTDMGEVSSKKSQKAKKYLDMVATKDAGTVDLTQLALKGWKNPVSPSLPKIRQPKAKTPLGYPLQSEKTLAEHDKRWHNGNYTGGACQFRKDRGIETYEKKDAPGEKSDKLESTSSSNKTLVNLPEAMKDFMGVRAKSQNEMNKLKQEKKWCDDYVRQIKDIESESTENIEKLMSEWEHEYFVENADEICEALDRPSWEYEDYFADYLDEVQEALSDDPDYAACKTELEARGVLKSRETDLSSLKPAAPTDDFGDAKFKPFKDALRDFEWHNRTVPFRIVGDKKLHLEPALVPNRIKERRNNAAANVRNVWSAITKGWTAQQRVDFLRKNGIDF